MKELKFSQQDIYDMLETHKEEITKQLSSKNPVAIDFIMDILAIGINVGGKMATESIVHQLAEHRINLVGPDNLIDIPTDELSKMLLTTIGPDILKQTKPSTLT